MISLDIYILNGGVKLELRREIMCKRERMRGWIASQQLIAAGGIYRVLVIGVLEFQNHCRFVEFWSFWMVIKRLFDSCDGGSNGGS